jgi:hypothetical protein
VATDRYPTPKFRRPALAPAILTTIVLIAGVALLESDAFIIIRFAVSILALIVVVFAWQASAWLYVVLIAAIAVLWNPVIPIPIEGQLGYALHYFAGLVCIVAGVRIKIRNDEDRNPR